VNLTVRPTVLYRSSCKADNEYICDEPDRVFTHKIYGQLCDLCIDRQKHENALVVTTHWARKNAQERACGTKAGKNESTNEDGVVGVDGEGTEEEDLEARYNAFEAEERREWRTKTSKQVYASEHGNAEDEEEPVGKDLDDEEIECGQSQKINDTRQKGISEAELIAALDKEMTLPNPHFEPSTTQ
jgi:hypothetical protein